jgi:erythromycin esterase
MISSINRHGNALRWLSAGVFLSFLSGACTQTETRTEIPPDSSFALRSDRSQDARVAWLRTHATPVRSVDPGDEDYSDLEPLKEIIGDARIVLLGEQTHYDALTFLAKTRLIKFLHQEMDFDVLAWESGIYDVHKAWELIENGEDVRVAVKQGIFPTWTIYEETRELFKYVGEVSRTDRPLILAGFDSQVTGSATRDFLLSDLRAFVADIGLDTLALAPGTPLADGFETLAGNRFRIPAENLAPDSLFLPALAELQARISSEASGADPRRTILWTQLLESLGTEVPRTRARILSYDSTATREERNAAFQREFNIRDAQMAKNLLWLAGTHYPERKIIGWLATAHAIHNGKEVDARFENPYPDLIRMGHLVWEALGDEVYVLGFTAYDMSAFEPHPVSDHSEEVEFEELMEAADFKYAIVDFRQPPPGGEWLREPMISRPMTNAGMKAVWPRVLDGMFYTRDWRPATRISR